MTVKNLIKILSKCSPEQKIAVQIDSDSFDSWLYDVLEVVDCKTPKDCHLIINTSYPDAEQYEMELLELQED